MRSLLVGIALLACSPAWAGGQSARQRIDTRQQVLEEALQQYDTPPRIIEAVREPVQPEPQPSLMPEGANDRLMDLGIPAMGTTTPAPVMAASQDFQVQVLVALAEINKDLNYLADSFEKDESERDALQGRIKELETERERIIGVVKYGAWIIGGISALAGLWGLKIGFQRKST